MFSWFFTPLGVAGVGGGGGGVYACIMICWGLNLNDISQEWEPDGYFCMYLYYVVHTKNLRAVNNDLGWCPADKQGQRPFFSAPGEYFIWNIRRKLAECTPRSLEVFWELINFITYINKRIFSGEILGSFRKLPWNNVTVVIYQRNFHPLFYATK